jgi:hypothetical protein
MNKRTNEQCKSQDPIAVFAFDPQPGSAFSLFIRSFLPSFVSPIVRRAAIRELTSLERGVRSLETPPKRSEFASRILTTFAPIAPEFRPFTLKISLIE